MSDSPGFEQHEMLDVAERDDREPLLAVHGDPRGDLGAVGRKLGALRRTGSWANCSSGVGVDAAAMAYSPGEAELRRRARSPHSAPQPPPKRTPARRPRPRISPASRSPPIKSLKEPVRRALRRRKASRFKILARKWRDSRRRHRRQGPQSGSPARLYRTGRLDLQSFESVSPRSRTRRQRREQQQRDDVGDLDHRVHRRARPCPCRDRRRCRRSPRPYGPRCPCRRDCRPR